MIPVEININYRSRWRRNRRLSFHLPESWSEIPEHIRFDSVLILSRFRGEEAQLRLLRLWTGIKKNIILGLTPQHLASILRVLDWVFAKDAKPYVSTYLHKGVTYYYPSEQFETGTAIEYPIADAYYRDYLEHGNPDDLIKLTATLCRPRKRNEADIIKTGDPREILASRDEAEARAKQLTDLPEEVQMMTFLYFDRIKALIHSTYGDYLFKGSDDEQDGGGLNFGWWSTYMDIAETGVFGNYEQVLQANFHTLCMFLAKRKSESDAREQKMNMAEAKQEIND